MAERLHRKAIERKYGDSTVDGGAAHCYLCNKTSKTKLIKRSTSSFFAVVELIDRGK